MRNNQQGQLSSINIWGNIFDLIKQAGKGGVIVAMTKAEAECHIDDADYDLSDDIDSKIRAALNRQW